MSHIQNTKSSYSPLQLVDNFSVERNLNINLDSNRINAANDNLNSL